MSRIKTVSLFVLCLAFLSAASGVAKDELTRRASWDLPDAAKVKSMVDQWISKQTIDEISKEEIKEIWQQVVSEKDSPEKLLEKIVRTIASSNKDVKKLIVLCETSPPHADLPQFDFLVEKSLPLFWKSNLKLYYGRWLSQHQFYDESLNQLEDLLPEDVVDPASLLFYQAVGYHHLLEKEKCIYTVAQLLENESVIPQRYLAVARLLEADILPLKKDSLDEISRIMADIRRRLGLGRLGSKVRSQEDNVIAKLDKMIEKLEKQRQQQQSQSSGEGQNKSNQPMDDSRAGGGFGPGKVDLKKISRNTDWGNLPPKQRQEVLQQIGKEFPSHFREVVEEYFRKIAREELK